LRVDEDLEIFARHLQKTKLAQLGSSFTDDGVVSFPASACRAKPEVE
jgi:hypothetical protein